MPDTTKKQQYLNKFTELDTQFKHWEGLYKDVTDYLLPEHGNYLDRGKPYESQNINRFDNILNDSGTRANQILGAGMQGGLASPSRRWFRLTMTDKDLSDFGPVKEWWHFVEKVLYGIYSASNFYSETHDTFESQGGFGTSVLMQDESPNEVVNFRTFDVGEYRLANGANGRVDTNYRMFWMTSKQMVEMFGIDKVSNAVKSAYENKKTPYEYHEVLHVLEPRSIRDTSKIDSVNKPFSSVWIEKNGDGDRLLRDSGYDEQPFVAPRWRKVGQMPYGFGPGLYARGNVKMLQEFEKTGIKALHKEVDPPLSVPSKYKDMISLLPSAVNYKDSGDNEKIEPILNVRMNLEGLEFKINKTESRIERTFFNDLFMMIINAERAGRDITATEILQKKEEKLLLLGPTIERQIKELLDPTIERTFNIALRNGLLPPPPPEIEGKAWEVEYISVLAQAQKLADAQSMDAYLLEVERVSQLEPGIVQKTDFEEYLEQYGDIVGVPPKIIRTKDEYAEIQQAQLEAQQRAAQMEQMSQSAATMKDMGAANTGEGSALGDLKEAIGG